MAHYVNNKEMLAAITQYRADLKEAEENGQPRPRIPEYLGECVLKIATNLARKPNFMNYSYRDEMVSDGIENCIMCMHSFDPEKSSNPFSYFTQVIYFAFIRRIQKEKKQSYTKAKIIQEMPMAAFDVQAHDEDNQELTNSYMDFMREHQDIDQSFERKKEEAKEKRKQKAAEKKNSLENFIEDEDESSDNN